MTHLLEAIARAERALAKNPRTPDGKHASCISVTASDLQRLVDAAAITAAAAQADEVRA